MVVLWVWVGVAVFTVVVLAFCSYELVWKGRRLVRDLARLTALQGELTTVRDGLATMQTAMRSRLLESRAG